MGGSSSRPSPPPKPQSVVPSQIQVVNPLPPVIIHGTYPEYHKSKHHEHRHHEHFMGLQNVTCENTCNNLINFLTSQNAILVLIIIILAYYITKQK